MIDYDALKETQRGERFDRLTALLIGLIAVLAATLVVVETFESLAEDRANANARRLASELTTRIIASGSLDNHRIVNGQRALAVQMEGNARALVGLQTGDAAEVAIGEAQVAAGQRLAEVAERMGAPPGAESPLDSYARDILGSGMNQLFEVLAEQNHQADLADAASTSSNQAVLGLSVVALAGVLVGLAAVLGSGRAGRVLLLVAWIAAVVAATLLVIAAGLVRSDVLAHAQSRPPDAPAARWTSLPEGLGRSGAPGGVGGGGDPARDRPATRTATVVAGARCSDRRVDTGPGALDNNLWKNNGCVHLALVAGALPEELGQRNQLIDVDRRLKRGHVPAKFGLRDEFDRALPAAGVAHLDRKLVVAAQLGGLLGLEAVIEFKVDDGHELVEDGIPGPQHAAIVDARRARLDGMRSCLGVQRRRRPGLKSSSAL